MTSALSDPLLLAAKALTGFLMFVLGAVALIVGIAAVILPFAIGWVDTDLAGRGIDALTLGETIILSASMFVLTIMLVLLTDFFRQLYRLIKSVGDADPFTPVNAARLARMGWLLIGAYISGMAMIAGFATLDKKWSSQGAEITMSFDLIDPGALLTILILFILARVFRVGAQMREDLEGTV